MPSLPRRAYLTLACALAAGLFSYHAAGMPAAQQAQQQEKDKEKDKKDEKKDEKKDAALFTGFRKVTGMEKSQEKQATVSAGARGVGEGKDIGNVPVSGADRAKVARMEAAKPGSQEMEAFLKEGKLSTSRKGGSQ